MKKINYLVALAVLSLLSVSLVSCSQNEETTNSQTTIEKVKEITNGYLEENGPSRLAFTEYLENDIYAFTKYYGSYKPGGTHGFSESVAFAADYSAWKAGVNNDDTNDIPTGSIDYSVVLPENVFDYVGLYHVQILDHILQDKTGRFMQGNDLNYEAVLQFNNQFLLARNLPVCTSSALDLNNLMIQTSANFNEINNKLSNAVTPNSEAEEILKDYFTALESSNSVTEFTAYSKEIELLIIGSQQFSEIEKQYLLTNMATSRHDFNYWMRAQN